MDKALKAEQSIHKTYRKTIWAPFVGAVKKYELIEEGDRIAVCVSGGKDSMLLAKLMQQLFRYSDFPFELEFLLMDPGFTEESLSQILSNTELLNIPVKVFKADIFKIAERQSKYPCHICASMRRGYLYKFARELNCNKIALGHHLNDVAETTLMAMLWSGQLQAMPPKLKSKNFPGMELIRPMYCVQENSIINWKNYNSLEFSRCACAFTSRGAERSSKRAETKELIARLKRENPNVEKNIFNSIHNVCLDTFVAYKQGEKEHSFLDNYTKD